MSARLLTDGHMARAVKSVREPESTDPPALQPDQMQLYSFYRPGLVAGDYTITTTQEITSDPATSSQQKILLTNSTPGDSDFSQEFEVIVPRFSLDPDLINSYYPPDGHQDEGRILPHIVLNDPHYPWEIPAGQTGNLNSVINGGRCIVPWVALLVFDADELHLSSLSDATNLNLPGFTTEEDLKGQNANGTFSMKVSDYFNTIASSARVNFQDADPEIFGEIKNSTDDIKVIFPQKALVKELLSSSVSPSENTAGLEQLKYLAHVRNINTEGCPDAGIEQLGLFSVVISPRTGALRDKTFTNGAWTDSSTPLSQPRTQVVHLVSIENLDENADVWSATSSNTDRIGLFSLFSWVYLALPPDPVNFVDTVRNLLEKQQMLRVDDTILSQLEAPAPSGKSVPAPQSILARRLQMGYTLARWRTETGEETASFNRGPLIPITVPNPPGNSAVPDCSATSKEFQIIDPETGLTDLSYSSAWQLGKLLAISDTTFSAALMRFRSLVRNAAANKTKMQLNNMSTGDDLYKDTLGAIKAIQSQSAGQTGVPVRVRTNYERPLLVDLTDIKILPVFIKNLQDAIAACTSNAALTGSSDPQSPYNSFSKGGANNSDWPTIHDWLAEKLSLGGIPSQYLVPEPSFVPPESLRFFNIDDYWMDCLIDGALSVANHLDGDDDIVRREIKRRFNAYLDTVVADAGIKPQIPTSGFFIRSKLIKSMPDLRITVVWKVPDARYAVCRWTRWDDQTLMGLFDRRLEEIGSITLSQPQHQQRYTLGTGIDLVPGEEHPKFMLRRLFTQAPGISTDGAYEVDASMTTTWLDVPTRRVNVQKMASDIHSLLGPFAGKDAGGNPLYNDDTANSCELGIELNDPAYFFQIKPGANIDTTTLHDRSGKVIGGGAIKTDFSNFQNRQIYIASTPTPPLPKDGNPNNNPDKPITMPNPPKNPTPLPPLPPAPTTSNRTQPYDPAKLPIKFNQPSGGRLFSSTYNLTVIADYKPIPAPTDTNVFAASNFIPTTNVNYFDLLFILRRKRPIKDSLVKITIDIPMSTATYTQDSNPEPLVSDKYSGAGLRMLSNQRFIPFLYTATFQLGVDHNNVTFPCMHIELIPRSANFDYTIPMGDSDADFRTVDLSFRLAQPLITPCGKNKTPIRIDGARGATLANLSTVWWTEYYAGGSVPTQPCVVRKFVEDPKLQPM